MRGAVDSAHQQEKESLFHVLVTVDLWCQRLRQLLVEILLWHTFLHRENTHISFISHYRWMHSHNYIPCERDDSSSSVISVASSSSSSIFFTRVIFCKQSQKIFYHSWVKCKKLTWVSKNVSERRPCVICLKPVFANGRNTCHIASQGTSVYQTVFWKIEMKWMLLLHTPAIVKVFGMVGWPVFTPHALAKRTKSKALWEWGEEME